MAIALISATAPTCLADSGPAQAPDTSAISPSRRIFGPSTSLLRSATSFCQGLACLQAIFTSGREAMPPRFSSAIAPYFRLDCAGTLPAPTANSLVEKPIASVRQQAALVQLVFGCAPFLGSSPAAIPHVDAVHRGQTLQQS